jgi:hypothetical protein
VSAEVVAKLRAGHIKIADKLGALYTMHPFRLDNPMDSSYAGDQLLVAFAADVAFSAPLKHNKAVWICYADQEQVEPLVFLDGPYGVFYIADKQPYQPMQAVRTNKRLNFGRGEYIQGGGEITQGVVNYATNKTSSVRTPAWDKRWAVRSRTGPRSFPWSKARCCKTTSQQMSLASSTR